MGETIRVEHSKDYTVISNAAIRDTRLSFKSRGLHHLLLSYPNGWQINIEHLSEQSDKDGKDAVASALKELETVGYLIRTQIRVKGKIVGYESTIRELPVENPPPPKGRRSKKKQDSPQLENPDTAKPDRENPQLEKPEPENPVLNKYVLDQLSKEEVSIPPTPQEKSEFSNSETQPPNNTPDNKTRVGNSPITSPEVGYSAAALQNIYTKAVSVYELIDLFLLSPEISDASPPKEMMLVFSEKQKWHGWVLPWRSNKMHRDFQNCNPEIVKKLATDLARKDKATPAQKYGHAIATINQWERTKGGWVNLMALCDRPILDQPSLSEASPEISIPQYIKDWYEAQHEYHYRTQFLKAASLDDFFAGKDNRAWHQFAKEKFPSWDWTKINSKIEDKTPCLLQTT